MTNPRTKKPGTRRGARGKKVRAYKMTVVAKYYARAPNGDKIIKVSEPIPFIIPPKISFREGWTVYKRTTQNAKGGFDIETKKKPKIVTVNALDGRHHYVLRYLLSPAIREQYPDAINGRVNEFIFTKIERIMALEEDLQFRTLDKTPIQEMKESELMQVVAIKNLTVDFSVYPDLADKKHAVEMALAQKLGKEYIPSGEWGEDEGGESEQDVEAGVVGDWEEVGAKEAIEPDMAAALTSILGTGGDG